jgi:hypothetical protein
MGKKEQFETEDYYPDLTQPHFDEDWTVLTARPVVPLTKLNGRNVNFGVLKLVGAFGAAILLGALVALASVKLRQEVASPNNSVASEEAQPQDEPVLDTAATELSATASSLEPVETASPTPEVIAKAPVRVTKKKPIDKEQSPIASGPGSLQQISQEVLSQPRLVGQWEEGRPRRVDPRPRRQSRFERQAIKRRDLFRVGEIFEGSRSNPE